MENLQLQGLDASGPYNLLNQAIDRFVVNDYEEAENLLKSSIEEAEKIKTSSLLFGVISKSELKFDIINFLRAYWWLILIIILILIIFGGISYTVLYIKLLNHRISNLRKEEATIRDFIRWGTPDAGCGPLPHASS